MFIVNAPIARVNTQIAQRDFKYYIFDWDDNILHMPTRIHMEKLSGDGKWIPLLVSTSVFSLIRNDTRNYRPPNGNWPAAFVEFQDYTTENENSFLRDTRLALERVLSKKEPPAPSFQTFRHSLIEGRLFAIVTARGHASQTLRKGVQMFIDNVLTSSEKEEMLANLRGYRQRFDKIEQFGTDEEELDYYLSLNHYCAVTSPHFSTQLACAESDIISPEARKQVAIRNFVEHIVRILTQRAPGFQQPVSVGFSDDDQANVAAVENYLRSELARHFPDIKFVVYDTSDPAMENGRKIVINSQLDNTIQDC